MKAAKKTGSSLGWKRFFVHVDEVNDSQDYQRRAVRSWAFGVLWVVGGLVGISLIVWHVLSTGYPGAH